VAALGVRTGFAGRPAPGALLLALALPFVFLHVDYQPTWTISLGSTSATIALSDLAVLAVGVAAIMAARRDGLGPLRRATWIWALGGAFLAYVFASTLWGRGLADDYRFLTHVVTAAKFAEYALLALAVPLLVRRLVDLEAVLAVLVVWSAAASVGAVLQFLGLVNEFEGRRPGQREPSFLGTHDLAALSGATLALGLAGIALGPLPRRRRILCAAGGAAGAVGLTLSGAVAGVIGIAVAAGVAAVLAHARGLGPSLARLGALAGVVVLVAGGVLALRSANVDTFLRFLGIKPAVESSTQLEGSSFAQRVVLGYIGIRIFVDHPLVGVGWQATSERSSYGPYLADAHRRYPDVPDLSFPSPRHRWGVQDAYIQAASELGVVGLALFLGLFASGLAVAWRALRRAPSPAALAAAVPILWLLVTMGVWIGLGLVAGIPLVGLTWLALGLAAAAPALADAES
jgi:putative inorganic carbon (hco3(-)) transporter